MADRPMLQATQAVINQLEKFGYMLDDHEREALGGAALYNLERALKTGQVSKETAALTEKNIYALVEKPPLASHLVGLAEAAEMLGWDKRKLATYRKRGVFPEPVQELKSGPVWLRSQIIKYAKTPARSRSGQKEEQAAN